MENRPTSNRRVVSRTAPKPYMTLSRWGAYGWLMSFFVLSGCMFVIGVVIGRNTAPVFDMDLMDAKMGRLKNSSLAQIEKGIEAAQKQKEHYLEVAKNIDIFESLKEKGKNLLAYKQFIPPLKAPKYAKNETPKDEPAPAEMQIAPAQPLEQPVQENMAAVSEPVEIADEPASQDKPILVKEAAPKPKHMTEPVKAPSVPLLAGIETKTEQTALINHSGQMENEPSGTAQEAASAAGIGDNESHVAVNDQPPVITEHALSENMPQETPPVEAECKPPAGSKQYTIQVASLREAEKANIVKDKFRQKGYPAYCQSSPVRGEVWHRVRIGPYPDRAIAEKDCRRLEEAGFDALMLIVNQ
jgi:cell division septation protein DedD